MAGSVAESGNGRHPVLPDTAKGSQAKAHVRNPDVAKGTPETDWNRAIGAAIQRAVLYVGWSNKEAAAKVGVDDAEFGKWLSGASGRRPQFDRLFAVEELREPLCVQLAALAGAVVSVEVRFRRAG